MVAPVKLTVVPDVTAVTLPLAQVVDAPGVVATTKPVGKLSVNEAEVSATVFWLSMRMVMVAAAPGALLSLPVVKPTGFAASKVLLLNALCMVRGDFARRVSVVGCELVADEPPTVALTAPIAIVFT